jgi:hypothetical protein
MYKQVVHIQSLIQKNSRLNINLLPEITEDKTRVEILEKDPGLLMKNSIKELYLSLSYSTFLVISDL